MPYDNTGTPAYAQEDQFDCASFGSQESARAELGRDPSAPNTLDPDGNGQVCEDCSLGAPGDTTSSPAPSSTDEGDDADASRRHCDDGDGSTDRPGDLMKSGGPTHGPILTMPDSSCLPEYPNKRNGYCYR